MGDHTKVSAPVIDLDQTEHIYDNRYIIRNATFRGDAGKVAQKLFGPWGGSAGGHTSAARAEIPLSKIRSKVKNSSGLAHRVRRQLKLLR